MAQMSPGRWRSHGWPVTSPSRRVAWQKRSRLLVVLVYGVVVAGVTLPTPLYVRYQAQWSLTNLEVTALYALYPVGVLAVMLLAGHWSDQVGRRAVVALALACSTASALMLSLAWSAELVGVARFVTGLASGFIVIAANALIVELASPAQRRHASLVSTGTNQIGIGLGAAVSGLLVEYAWEPMRLVFLVHVAALAAAAVCLSWIPETVTRTRRLSLRLRSLRFPVANRTDFLTAGVASFSAFALLGLLAALAPSLVREQLHQANAALAGGAVAAVFIASGTTQFFWARITERRTIMVGLGALIASLGGMTASLQNGSFTWFAASVTLGGVAVGATLTGSLSLVNGLVSGDDRGRVTSTYFAITFAGLIAPVLATGLAADYVSQARATAFFALAIGAAAVVAAILLVRASSAHGLAGKPQT